MKRVLMMAVGILLVGMMCAQVYAQDKEVKKAPVNIGNTVCPVMGTKVEPGKSLTVEYDGKLYNVCCPVCVKTFNDDPKKYADIAEKQVKKQNEAGRN